MSKEEKAFGDRAFKHTAKDKNESVRVGLSLFWCPCQKRKFRDTERNQELTQRKRTKVMF